MKIISDDGEGSTVEEGTTDAVEFSPDEVVLVVRPDMTYRLIIPGIALDEEVPVHTLITTAVANLIKHNPEWVEDIINDIFSQDEEDSDLGPGTMGSA